MKALVPLTVTILTYLLLSLVWSDYGIIAHQRLERYHDRLENNVEELERRRQELKSQTRSLRTDADRVRVEARTLGYLGENEGRVRIEGFEPESNPTSPGGIVRNRRLVENHAAVLRSIAAGVGLLALFLMLIFDQPNAGAAREARRRRTSHSKAA
ncbi:MAG: septum formation initiator family protein [Spirochaetota bacterium]